MRWVNSKFILSQKNRKFSTGNIISIYLISIPQATHRKPIWLIVVVPDHNAIIVVQVAVPSVKGTAL
jgi:hypothetical protein